MVRKSCTNGQRIYQSPDRQVTPITALMVLPEETPVGAQRGAGGTPGEYPVKLGRPVQSWQTSAGRDACGLLACEGSHIVLERVVPMLDEIQFHRLTVRAKRTRNV